MTHPVLPRSRVLSTTRRKWTGVAVVSIAAHHAMELAAGIGVPGEPLIGRRPAVLAWGALFPLQVAVASVGERRWDRLLAAANGSFQALALQHYLSWQWRLHGGIPTLTDAEGLPARWLPAYNLVLLAAIVSSTIDRVGDRVPGCGKTVAPVGAGHAPRAIRLRPPSQRLAAWP